MDSVVACSTLTHCRRLSCILTQVPSLRQLRKKCTSAKQESLLAKPANGIPHRGCRKWLRISHISTSRGRPPDLGAGIKSLSNSNWSSCWDKLYSCRSLGAVYLHYSQLTPSELFYNLLFKHPLSQVSDGIDDQGLDRRLIEKTVELANKTKVLVPGSYVPHLIPAPCGEHQSRRHI